MKSDGKYGYTVHGVLCLIIYKSSIRPLKCCKAMSMTKEQPNQIITLGGRIQCAQCQARSKRSGLRCRAPAVNGKYVCRMHGALSTGPRTDQGRQRCAEVKTKHGRETRKARELRTLTLKILRDLEYVGRSVGLIHGPKTVGRKPK